MGTRLTNTYKGWLEPQPCTLIRKELAMATKELVKAEIDTVPDEAIDELYDLVKDFKQSKIQSDKPKSFFEAIRGITIDAPPDFSTRYNEYLYGDITKQSNEEDK